MQSDEKSEKGIDGVELAWKELWQSYPREYDALALIEASIAYRFERRAYLFEAMTHRSAVMAQSSPRAKKSKRLASLPWNERIEFLGDSVLGLVISTLLWHKRERYSEGELSRIRSSLVNEGRLAEIARHMLLGRAIVLGKGEEKSGGRQRDALLADALEALLGAIYLDGGYQAAANVIRRLFTPYLDEPFDITGHDYKTRLQEWAQEAYQETPEYRLVAEQGPDHAKEFEISVHLAGKPVALGKGASKKRASQEAAKQALLALQAELVGKLSEASAVLPALHSFAEGKRGGIEVKDL